MKKVYLHFKSDKEFNLFINGEYVDLCEQDASLDIVMTTHKLTYICCPISNENSHIVSSGIIEFDGNKVIASSKNVELIPYGECHYDIVIMTESVYKMSEYSIINQRKIGSINVIVYNNSYGYIDIMNVDNCVEKIKTQSAITLVDIDEIDNSICVQCVTMDTKRYIILLSKDNGKLIYRCLCDSVDIAGNKIKCLTDLNNLLGVAKVSEYTIDTAETKEYCVYLNKYKKVDNDLVVPYAFLHAIESENYNIAREYMADTFAGVQDVQLANYFGKIEGIYYNQYNLDDKICYTVKASTYRGYEFVVQNAKIVDIKEIQLS